MKLLVASHLYPNPLSHLSGVFVHGQVRFLQRYAEVQVVSPRPFFPLPGLGRWSAYRRFPLYEEIDGVPVWRPAYITLPRRLFFEQVWRSYRRALEHVAIAPPDLIHAHVAYPDGLAAVAFARSCGVPAVLTVHGNDMKVLPRANRRWRYCVQAALDGVAAVIAVSHQLGEIAVELGCPADRVRHIPNGVDGEIFAPDFTWRPGTDTWHLIYAGRFDPAKGIGVLLRALALLARRDVRLTLVGGNPVTGSAECFRSEVIALGLGDRVCFLDEVPWQELPRLLARADMFVLPSFSEGLPLVLLEALSCGLPVLSTRCGGPEEIVDESNGRLVAVGDVHDLAAALADMLDNYDRYDRAAIRQRALARYDYRHLAQRLFSLYQEVLR